MRRTPPHSKGVNDMAATQKAMKQKSNDNKVIYYVGLIIGLALLVAGGVLVAITHLETVASNPYNSVPSDTGILYGVLFGVGFVIFVTFLDLLYEARSK